MSLANVFMLSGLAMMFIMMITMFVVACKLCSIRDDVFEVYRKMNGLQTDVSSIRSNVFEATVDISHIDRLIKKKEAVKDSVGGLAADVAVIDELVSEDEDEEIDIHLITPEEFYFSHGFRKHELMYYPNSDQVRYYFDDHSYLAMDDVPEHIGEGLLFFGMNVKEPNVVYVRNHILNADFRIEKVANDV